MRSRQTVEMAEMNKQIETLSIEQIAKEIIARGNEMEVRRTKDGMKIFEVSKRLIKEIKND